jgi:hypothetical protein
MGDKLKFCKGCHERGDTSIVRVIRPMCNSPVNTTFHMIDEFYGEDGRYHLHLFPWDIRLECTRGHFWVEAPEYQPCPACGMEYTKIAEPDHA